MTPAAETGDATSSHTNDHNNARVMRRQLDDTASVRLVPVARAMAGCLVASVALACGVGLSVWLMMGRPAIRHSAGLQPDQLFALLKLDFAVIGGIGGIVALVLAYRRQRVIEAKQELDAQSHALAIATHAFEQRVANIRESFDESNADRERIRVLNDRFITACAQLGNESATVRLAGVYAVAALADDWESERKICLEVLCGYLRMPYIHASAPRGEREVRQSIVRVIRDHLRRGSRVSWRGHDFDFTGATFDGADFQDAIFSGGTITFANCEFIDGAVDFGGAHFCGACLYFGDSRLSSGAALIFLRASFSRKHVWLSFPRMDFDGGQVMFDLMEHRGGSISFDSARISGTTIGFSRAKFNGGLVEFDNAIISGDGVVDFAEATVAGDSVLTFRNVRFNGGLVDLSKATIRESGLAFDRWKTPPTFLKLPSNASGPGIDR